MKLGIIVDGIAEFGSIPLLTSRIPTAATMGPVVFGSLDPLAPVGTLILRCQDLIENALLVKGVTRTIVLIDLDGRVNCARTWALSFQREVDKALSPLMQHGAFAVIKNGAFENWLVSDAETVNSIAKFSLSANDVRQVRGNADNVNAYDLLQGAARAAARARGRNYDYEKTDDARLILSRARPAVMAESSRSFRRFLKVVGCTGYATAPNTKTPIPAAQIVVPTQRRATVSARKARRRA